jgi:protease PrsW
VHAYPPGPLPPPPGQWRYRPRHAFLENRALRAGALTGLLALCGFGILALVQQSVGTEGFFVGLALSLLPVPLLVGAFMWLDRVEPEPWRNLLFAFAWGACAATLIAVFANQWATHWLFSINPSESETLSLTVAAPMVEETAKGAAVLLLFLYRRRDFDGIVDGVVIAGLTATGFAFTENILYLGDAFGEDLAFGHKALGGVTVMTFFMRVIVSPFAHPLFTCMTGVGFGLASLARGRAARVLAPVGGLLVAMVLHGVWNGSSVLGLDGFALVYGVFMVPVFGSMVWLAVWSRGNELRTVGRQLPLYACAGWLTPPEPLVLSSMRGRRIARDLARSAQGEAGARAMREYQGFATALAFLRAKAARCGTPADFTAREHELLHHLWRRRPAVQGPLTQAALSLPRPRVAPAPPWARVTPGWQGTQSWQGTLGWQGTPGWQGTLGQQGTPGWQGTLGQQGTPGWQGTLGQQGTPGWQGPQGQPEPNGWQTAHGWADPTGQAAPWPHDANPYRAPHQDGRAPGPQGPTSGA